MRRQRFSQLNKNKGFTLVELIVVLVLLVILLAVSIAGLLTWQDWSRFKKENTAAETIFYAAQNQLSELSATGVYKDKVVKVVGNKGSLLLDAPESEKNFFNGTTISYGSGNDDYYKWQPTDTRGGTAVWANTPSSASTDEEREKYQGRIYFLRANAGDYSRYINGEDFGEDFLGTKLLFDLITPYISDKSVLNGAINLEFSPEAMQVFSVCYSDRTDSLTYDDVGHSKTQTSVLDRSEETRRDALLGYFAADSLSIPLEGKSIVVKDSIELINAETLHLIINEEALDPNKLYSVEMYRTVGKTIDPSDEAKLMSFTFHLDNSSMNNDTWAKAAANPTEVEVDLKNGKYANLTKTLRIPILTRSNPSDPSKYQIILVFDAADVQAQSYLYADGTNAPYESFLNTYSFYRYGFDMANILKVGCVVSTEDNPSGASSNTEYPTFKEVKETTNGSTYFIKNGRHFYNVRFETDYKVGEENRTFLLTNDIDWKVFTGATGGTDYYLDSYKTGLTINGGKAGIHYDGQDHTINQSEGLVTHTSNYAFPGFRSLGKNDVFTGLSDDAGADEAPYTISNLTITFASNMTYGVYGKASRDEWVQSLENNNITLFGQYNNGTGRHQTQVKAMKGELPLGLFAENSGTITNLTLNAHKVIGMEELSLGGNSSVLVYTNMVGGFTGDNLGVISNLTLRDVSSLDQKDTRENEAGVTFVNGKTDVGGILGRQSWSVVTKYVELKNLKNYGKVTGMENIGGIVGRAYVIRDFNTQGGNDTFNKRKAYYEDGYSIYGEYVLTGNNAKITPGQSITGKEVFCADEIKITDCSNRGRVAGDELIAEGEKIVTLFDGKTDVSNTLRRCSNIGGIAGITMDGYFIENTATYNGKTWYGHHTGDLRVQLKNCDSYRLYTDAEINSIVSTSGGNIGVSGQNRDIRNNIEHDFYVGGLVGYARMTLFEDCSNQPLNDNGNYDSDKQLCSFVFGRNYVGGLFGCFDGCEVPTTGATSSRIKIENYANTIGIMFVGGFAGSSGIGDGDISTFSFKRPATNEGSQSTMIPGDTKVLSGVCNHGAVLAVRRDVLNYTTNSNIYKQDNIKDLSGVTLKGSRAITGAPDASVGGVIGIAASDFNNLDSEQSAATKRLVLRLVGFASDYYNAAGDLTVPENTGLSNAQALVNTQSYSYYGGNAVGGIVGKVRNGVTINNSSRDYCRMNSVVWGFDGTGGIFGTAGTDLKGEKDLDISVYNTFVDGGLILGRDTVGGIAGRGTSNFNNNTTIVNDEYSQKHNLHVVGRYGAGGVFGYTGIYAVNNRNINANIDGSDATIKVEALAVAGGYAGVINQKSTLSGKVKNVSVNAEYYAGGAFGCLFTNKDRTGMNRDVQVENVFVEARTAFAGGYIGLYGSNNNLSADDNDFCLMYSVYTPLTGYGTDKGNPLLKFIDGTLVANSDNRTSLYTLMNTIAAAESGTGIYNAAYSGNYLSQSLSNNVSIVNAGTNVKAKIFAGGLFGYITPNLCVTINCPTSGVVDSVQTDLALETKELNKKDNKLEESFITNDGITSNGTRLLSYTGGIVGKIPTNVAIANATYQGVLKTNSSYIGQIAEVNCGRVENSTICAYLPDSSKPAFAGGLVGLNSTSGTFGTNIRFANNNGLGGDGYTVVGALCGENIGTISVDALGAFNDSSATQIKASTAVGLLTGYNGTRSNGVGYIDTKSTLAARVLSTSKLSGRYAGVYAGINAGTIYNSNVQTYLSGNGAALEDFYDASKISDTTGYSVNANLLGNGCTYAGLLAGKNIGTISNIYVRSTGNKQKGEIKTTNAYTYLGGLVGQNGDASHTGTIEKCVNTMTVGNASNTATAAGFAAVVNGNSKIKDCINSGAVNASENAGGIAGISESPLSIRFENCVNLGILSGDSANRAGIAVSTGDKGEFTLCRNYGTGALYGISAGNVLAMTKCLDNSGLNEGTETAPTHPLAPNDDNSFVRNFYISGTTDDVTVPANTGSESMPVSLAINSAAFSITFSDEILNHKADGSNNATNAYGWGAKNVLAQKIGIYASDFEDAAYWNYILIAYFERNPENLYTYMSKLFAAYCYDRRATLTDYGLVNYSDFYAYAKNVIAKGNLECTGEDTNIGIGVDLAAMNITVSDEALNIDPEADESNKEWKKYFNGSWSNSIGKLINYQNDEADASVAYFYFTYRRPNANTTHSENEYRELMAKLYAECWVEKGSQPTEEELIQFAKQVVATGKLPTENSGEDLSHWPVQLYYYGGDGTKGLYFKRKYYHFAGIELEVDPADINEALDRFVTIDAQFRAMANNETDYPNSSGSDYTSPVGFVNE